VRLSLADLPFAFQCAKQLIHLLHPALDAFGRPDLPSAAQGTRLFHQILAIAGGPQVHAGAFFRQGRSAGWSFALCSHESSPPKKASAALDS